MTGTTDVFVHEGLPEGGSLNPAGLSQQRAARRPFISQCRQWLACISATLTMVVVGTVYGWTTTSLPHLTSGTGGVPLKLTNDESSWIVSLSVLGSMIGSLLGAQLADRSGRKYCLLLCSTIFTLGWLIIYAATSVSNLYLSRLILGIGVGIAYTINPIYVSEVADINIRGALGTLIAVNVFAGSLLTCVLGLWLSYKSLLVVLVIISFISFLSNTYFPETPYFLVAKGRKKQACRSIKYYKGIVDPHEMEIALRDLRPQIKCRLQPRAKSDLPSQSRSNYPLQLRSDFISPSRSDFTLSSRNYFTSQSGSGFPSQTIGELQSDTIWEVDTEPMSDLHLPSSSDSNSQSISVVQSEVICQVHPQPKGELHPQSTSEVHPASMSKVHPPSTSKVHSPSTSEIQPPSTSKEHPPSTSQVHPPSTSQVHSPSTSEIQPPSISKEHPPSSSQVHSPSTSEVHPPSTCEIRRSSTSEIQRPSTCKVHRSSICEVHRPSTSEKHRPSTSKIHRSSTSEIQPPSISKVHPPSTSQVHPPSTSEVHRSSICEVHRPSTSEKHRPSTSKIHRSSTSEIQPPSISKVHPPSTSQVHPPSTSEVHPPSTCEIRRSSTSEIHRSSTSQVHPPSTSQVHPPSTSQEHPPSTSQEHPPSTSQVHPPSTSEIQPEPTSETQPKSDLHLQSRSDLRTQSSFSFPSQSRTQSSTDSRGPVVYAAVTKQTCITKLRKILQQSNRKALFIMLGLIMAQQLSGNFITMQYLEVLFGKTTIGIKPNVATILVLAVGFISGILSTLTVEYLGRRTLLILSTLGSCFTLIILATYLFLVEYKFDVSSVSTLPIIDLIVYQVMFQIGLGTLPNVLLCEIFPSELKGFVGAITVIFDGIIGFTVSKLYQVITDNVGSYSIYSIFAISCSLAFLMVFTWVPETKGKTYYEIKALLSGKNLNSFNVDASSDEMNIYRI